MRQNVFGFAKTTDAPRASGLLLAVLLCAGCKDPPADGSLKIDIARLATRPGFSQLNLTVETLELFYGAIPPPAPLADSGDCSFPGETIVATNPIAISVDLTQTGRTFLGAFFAPPGHITEIRMAVHDAGALVNDESRRAHLAIRCEGGDTNGLLRLMPSSGESVDIVQGETTEVAVQFDPTRDIVVDGQGGGYDAGNTPSSCNPGPCGKPFKLASDYDLQVVTTPSVPGIYTDRVAVGFKTGVDSARIADVNAGIGATIIGSDTRTNFYLMRLPATVQLTDALTYYTDKDEVESALPDSLIGTNSIIPCNPDFQNPGPFTDVDAPSAWSTTVGSSATLMAVVDSGFDLRSPNLVSQYFINQKELTGVHYFDLNRDGTVTAAELASQTFDTNHDGVIDFVDLNDPSLKCLCADPAGFQPGTTCASTCPGHPEYSTCDVDCDAIVTPLDLVNGNCPQGQCVADGRWQDGSDNDNNQRIDDLVGWDFADNDNDVDAAAGAGAGCGLSVHGNAVAGVMAAIGAPPPAKGQTCPVGLTAGMDWRTRLLPVRINVSNIPVSDVSESSRAWGVIGISYAAAQNADVINASFGVFYVKDTSISTPTSEQTAGCGIVIEVPGNKFDTAKSDIAMEATKLGLGASLLVTGSGNCGYNEDDPGTIKWPGAKIGSPNVITVAGTNQGTQTLATFPQAVCGQFCTSGFGATTVDIAAPATNFTTLNPATGVDTMCYGTSFSAPLVAGTIGLMVAANPSLHGDPATIKKRLLCNARNANGLAGQIAGNDSTTGRFLNVADAVLNTNNCP